MALLEGLGLGKGTADNLAVQQGANLARKITTAEELKNDLEKSGGNAAKNIVGG